MPRTLLAQVLHPELGPQGASVASTCEELYRGCPSRDPRDRTLAMDLGLQLPEEFLMMTDRFSMAHSLEARVPLLDQDFVELVLRRRKQAKMGDLKKEWKEAVQPLIPQELTAGASKRGFVLPTERWLRGPWRKDLEEKFSPAFLRRQGLFQTSLAEKVIFPFLSGNDNYGPAAWTLFMFQEWYEHVGSPA